MSGNGGSSLSAEVALIQQYTTNIGITKILLLLCRFQCTTNVGIVLHQYVSYYFYYYYYYHLTYYKRLLERGRPSDGINTLPADVIAGRGSNLGIGRRHVTQDMNF